MPDLPSHQHANHHQLRQILATLRDGVILIEPDQSISWANAAALAMHGVSDVAGLGANVSEYRSRFELRYRNRNHVPEGHSPMERVLKGEAFDEVVVEVAPAGENEAQWTHRIRSLVLTDQAGRPDCLVLITSDETQRFEAEERFEATFAANPAPAVILRLSDHRHVKVNKGFLEMTGYREEEVLARSAYEIDVLEGAARREFAIERLQQGRTIPQMEATLQLPGGGEKRVIVAGQPIEVANTACMLFTFVDLERHKQVEASLRDSKASFATALQLIPLPSFVAVRADCQLLLMNEAFCAATGYVDADLVGKTVSQAHLWSDKAAGVELERQISKAGRVRELPMRLRAKEGEPIDCLVSAEAMIVGDKPCVLVVAQDVTQRRHSEAEIVQAIEAVMQDTSSFSQMVFQKLAKLRRRDAAEDMPVVELNDLSMRGREVLELVGQGLDIGAIAQKLRLSRNTIRNHLAALYRKTGVRSRVALVIWARERQFSRQRPTKPTKGAGDGR